MPEAAGEHRQDNAEAVREETRSGDGIELSRAERREVERKLPPSVQVLHEAVRIQGELELERSSPALAWSSLAAGLSMGFSMLVPALLQAPLQGTAAAAPVVAFGYSIGFLVVILARQQLFTENTTTAVLPFMTHPGLRALLRLLRVWGIVLAGNLVGGGLFALAMVHLPVVDAPVRSAMGDAARGLVAQPTLVLFSTAVIAGWLIATMVWLMAAAQGAKTFLVLLMTWLVGLGGFAHVIVGAIEAQFLLYDGQLGVAGFFSFLWPTLLGNVVGGSLIFALVSHAQVRSDAP
jgi:formate/nitrite transporter FocA (FNT family)